MENMSQVYSAIQQQYPLSPLKFWKKIISQTVGWGIVIIFASGIIGLLFGIMDNNYGTVFGKFLMALLIGLAIYIVLVFAPYAIYVDIYIRRYYYDINENFITIKKGVFAPAEIHVQFQKIQDVYVDQD